MNIIHKYVCTLAYSYTLAYNLHYKCYKCTYQQLSMTMYIKTQMYTQYFGLRIQRKEILEKKNYRSPFSIESLEFAPACVFACVYVCGGGEGFIYVCNCMHAQLFEFKIEDMHVHI